MRKIDDLLYNKVLTPIILGLLLLPNCYFGDNPLISALLQYSGLVLMVLLLIFSLLIKQWSRFLLYFVLYCAAMIVSCIFGEKSSIIRFFSVYSNIISITLYLHIGLIYKTKLIIDLSNILFFILVLINFVTIIVFPDGLYKTANYTSNWFFKYDNLHIMMYIPAILFGYLSTKYNGRKKWLFLIEATVISFCIIYCHSATSLVAYAILLFYLFFNKVINKCEIFNAKNYFVLFVLIFVFIVVFRVQNYFSWLIEGILNKDLTFTGRTYLWDTIVEYIKKRPLIGYGIESSAVFTTKMGSDYYTHAHNTIFDVLYKGGIAALLPFSAMVLSVIKKVANNRSLIAKTMSFILLSLFVMLNFEAREEKIGLYIILIVIYNVNIILADIKKRKETRNDEMLSGLSIELKGKKKR